MEPRANRIGCAEFHENLRLSRRGFVRAGILGTTGLALSGPFHK
jgi:hypothetical protein